MAENLVLIKNTTPHSLMTKSDCLAWESYKTLRDWSDGSCITNEKEITTHGKNSECTREGGSYALTEMNTFINSNANPTPSVIRNCVPFRIQFEIDIIACKSLLNRAKIYDKYDKDKSPNKTKPSEYDHGARGRNITATHVKYLMSILIQTKYAPIIGCREYKVITEGWNDLDAKARVKRIMTSSSDTSIIVAAFDL